MPRVKKNLYLTMRLWARKKGKRALPNYYAHLNYGKRVYESLSPELQRDLRREWDAFCLGLYGPDPLMVYKPIRNDPAHGEGLELHKHSPLPFLEKYRRSIAEGVPYTKGYAAGFLCHYILDAKCHSFVYPWAKRGGITHYAMEGEFDRYLMEKDGIDAAHETPLHCGKPSTAVDRAASLGYRWATPEIFRKSVDQYYRYSRLLTKASCTPAKPVTNAAARCIPGISKVHGLILGKKPVAGAEETNGILMERMKKAVPEGAQQVAELMTAGSSGRAWKLEADTDFRGRRLSFHRR